MALLRAGFGLAFDLVAQPRGFFVVLGSNRFLKLRLKLRDRIDRKLLADLAGELPEDFDFVGLRVRFYLPETGEEFLDALQAFVNYGQGTRRFRAVSRTTPLKSSST
jgi:hypothetical protein